MYKISGRLFFGYLSIPAKFPGAENSSLETTRKTLWRRKIMHASFKSSVSSISNVFFALANTANKKTQPPSKRSNILHRRFVPTARIQPFFRGPFRWPTRPPIARVYPFVGNINSTPGSVSWECNATIFPGLEILRGLDLSLRDKQGPRGLSPFPHFPISPFPQSAFLLSDSLIVSVWIIGFDPGEAFEEDPVRYDLSPFADNPLCEQSPSLKGIFRHFKINIQGYNARMRVR